MAKSYPPSASVDATTELGFSSRVDEACDARAYVVVRSGDAVDVLPIDERAPLVIGRGPEVGVRADDARVSRRHAEIALRSGSLVVEDFGSRNGTRVGQSTIRGGERALTRGDEIVVGSIRVTVVAVPIGRVAPFSDGVVLADPRTRDLFAFVERVAAVPTAVLVRGETGVGKEIVAEHLHRLGRRASGPLVRINCAAVPEALLESELFGHEKGAFTGATDRKRGLFELADKGTLFLDEVGDLPLVMQAKLLRVLETQRLQRVGGREEISIDIRLVSATHRDLAAMVAAAQFRGDLYYRIAGIALDVPPLRERPADLRPLAERFVASFAAITGVQCSGISESAFEALAAHRWPGNVRELKNAIEHAVVLAGGGPISVEHLPPTVRARDAEPIGSMREHVHGAERKAIEEALAMTSGNRGRAAERLGISKRTLQYRLAKLGIKR